MSNYEKAKELTQVAAESQGAAELKYQAYMDSAEAATKRVQNAWEGLTTSLRASDALKGIKNTVAWFVENLDKILTTLTSIWAGLKAARISNIIRNAGGLGNFFSSRLGKGGSIRSGLNASTTEEILEAQKTGGGRFGLKLKKGSDWYMGKDKSTIASYMPTFRDQLASIIRLLGGKTTGDGTAAPGTVGSAGTPTPTTGGAAATGAATVVAPSLATTKFTTKSGKTYDAYVVNGNTYYATAGGWHDSTGSFVSMETARRLGLVGGGNKPAAQSAANAATPATAASLSKSAKFASGLKAGAVSGIISGLTTGFSVGTTMKTSDGADASGIAKTTTGAAAGTAVGGLTAIGAGIGSMIAPGIGTMIGSMAGGLLGNALNMFKAPWDAKERTFLEMLADWIDADAVSRRERAKHAGEILNAIHGIKSDTAEIRELADAGEWNFDNYQKASSMATSMMTKLYSEPDAAREIYASLTGENIDKLTDSQVLTKLESLVNDEFLNASPTDRRAFASRWEYATADALDVQAFAAAEDDIYNRNDTIAKDSWGVWGAGGKESQFVDQFVAENSEYVQRQGHSNLLFAGRLSERVQTARRLREYLRSNGIQSSNLIDNLNKYIQDFQGANSDMSKSAREFTENALNAAGASLELSNRSKASIKKAGRNAIAKELLDAFNARGGLYEFDETTGETIRTPAIWTGSLDTLPDAIRNELLKYINNDELLSSIFTNNQGYQLGEILSGNIPGLSEEGRDQYLMSFARALGMTVDQLIAMADTTDRLKEFTLGDLSKGYTETKSDIESLSGILNSMASASGLTADNMETILSKFPTLAKYLTDESSLAKAIYDDLDILIQAQQENLVATVLENEQLFDDWKKSLPKEMQEVIEKTSLDGATSAEDFYLRFLKLSEKDMKTLGEDVAKQIDKLWNSEFNNMESVVSIATEWLDIQASYLSKVYDIQIKNLESQKTALQQITSQREYENKLIDARNKLENAQNEKHQVYREGVGIVYEADQEAVQQAQKELDELDRQKEISELEVMITELQSQKSWLDQESERKAFHHMENMFEQIVDDKSGLWGSIISLEEMYKKVNHLSTAGVGEQMKQDVAQQKETGWSTYNAASKNLEGMWDVKTALEEFVYSGDDTLLKQIQSSDKYSDEVRTYVTGILQKYPNGGASLSHTDRSAINSSFVSTYEGYGKTQKNAKSNLVELGETVNEPLFSKLRNKNANLSILNDARDTLNRAADQKYDGPGSTDFATAVGYAWHKITDWENDTDRLKKSINYALNNLGYEVDNTALEAWLSGKNFTDKTSILEPDLMARGLFSRPDTDFYEELAIRRQSSNSGQLPSEREQTPTFWDQLSGSIFVKGIASLFNGSSTGASENGVSVDQSTNTIFNGGVTVNAEIDPSVLLSQFTDWIKQILHITNNNS